MERTTLRSRKNAVLICCSLIVLFAASTGYALQVTFLVGDVKLMRKKQTMNLTERTPIKSGDTIITGNRALVAFSYKDGSRVEVREKSRIMVGNESVKNSEFVSVISGVVKGKFQKLTKGEPRRVYTPTTVCAIRGTEFSIAVSDGGNSRVALNEGKLEVRNPYGRVNINEGDNTTVKVSERPVSDDDDPDLDEFQNDENTSFQKNPQQQGERYRNYMGKFQENNGRTSRKIQGFKRNFSSNKRGGKESLERAAAELDTVNENLEDDMYLNNAANSSVNCISDTFKGSRDDLYNTFQTIKSDSDRISAQQQSNYQALTAVREAYRKAYEEIVKRHHSEVDRMRDMLRKQRESQQR
ncbi:MAG TPA: FecR family protein [Spirochaetota bacterium]|nr:FecR family protein [Spirochaetota bacterium]HPQ53514.1 FecR family protein [Spirochaetota bacterium]